MPVSTEGPPAQGVDPLAPIEHALQWASGFAVHLALGLLLGLLAARAMRARHLHWSWAAAGLAPVLLAREPLAGSATPLAVAALAAAARGRRWHREDIEAGADLAELAAERRRPLDALRAGARLARARLDDLAVARRTAQGPTGFTSSRRAARRDRWFRGNRLTLGVDTHGRAVTIALGGSDGGTHTLVVGATGSGKTVTQAWIAAQAIAHGMGAVIVDPKGDRALREVARRAAAAAGRRYVEWTPRGPAVYNPCARGSETEIADRVLAAERYSEPHYQRQAQRYLGHAVRVLQRAGLGVSLAALVRALDPAQLEVLARAPVRGRRSCA